MLILGRCGECGGSIELKYGPGRFREYIKGVWKKIPDSFGTPACTRCGEEYMVPEISSQLDKILTRNK